MTVMTFIFGILQQMESAWSELRYLNWIYDYNGRTFFVCHVNPCAVDEYTRNY